MVNPIESHPEIEVYETGKLPVLSAFGMIDVINWTSILWHSEGFLMG